ncbi:BolA family transcriptional regulator [Candidatus Bandiella numerosa]|jgi:BolA protein|uniref:BolA family protein n=1 Tax=Candidatus Bandiella numerosa TaxID=2570586 RepID=UPI00249DE745|nr:BolA family protein [Candidatus Bandiella numerosa]WHA04898.1 BolA family transcriptional regulator [Candidatus Bandiella numerosa]
MRQATKINIKDQIENKLREKLDVIFLNLKDESYLHANHNEEAKAGGTHLSLMIVARDFDYVNLLGRHKIINQILKDEFKIIHALKIKAYNGKEYIDNNVMQKACLQNKNN